MKVRELGTEWDGEWDALSGEAPEAGFMQSSAWAAFKRAEGYVTRRFGLFDPVDDALIGGASLLFYPGADAEGYWICPEGPVLPWDDTETARAGLRALIDTVRDLADQSGGIGLRIEPHLEPPAPSLLRNWTRAPVDLAPVHTLMIDVAQPDDALLGRMAPKGRYNIRLADRHGVRVRRSCDLRDMAAFYRLFEESARRDDFFAEPYGFFLNLGAALFPSRAAELVLAEWQGEPLAALLVVYHGRRATYLYGGTAGHNRHVMPAYAAQWAAIRAAREHGCREYDLYGYDPFGIPDHLYAGISRFKRQLGGDRRDWIGARDLIFYDRLAAQVLPRLGGLHLPAPPAREAERSPA